MPECLSQNATEKAVARNLNRPVQGVMKWYAVEASAVPELLGVNPNQGLTESEVVIRRSHYGANSGESWRSRRVTTVSLMLFSSIFIGFLTTAAVLSSAIAHSVEAFSLILVTVVGAILGFVSLLKSARAFDVMEEVTGTNACLKRGGHDIELKAEELVTSSSLRLENTFRPIAEYWNPINSERILLRDAG